MQKELQCPVQASVSHFLALQRNSAQFSQRLPQRTLTVRFSSRIRGLVGQKVTEDACCCYQVLIKLISIPFGGHIDAYERLKRRASAERFWSALQRLVPLSASIWLPLQHPAPGIWLALQRPAPASVAAAPGAVRLAPSIMPVSCSVRHARIANQPRTLARASLHKCACCRNPRLRASRFSLRGAGFTCCSIDSHD